MIEVSIMELNGLYSQIEEIETKCKLLKRQINGIRKSGGYK